jgi:ABC-type cobalamin/Fe3+-siderophores transport system ATPase subunit
MIQASGATVTRGGVQVLGPLDLAIEDASIVAIVGPNGAGKSSLIEAIAGTLLTASGTIRIDATATHALSPAARRDAIAVYTQASEGPFGIRALDVCLFGAPGSSPLFGLPSAESSEAALDWLRRLGADHLAERPLQQLSGGERQRILVARALTQNARYLLLDEPTSAQDYRGSALIAQAIQHRRRRGQTTIVSMHDVQAALNLADRLLVLDEQGRACVFGPPADVAPAIETLYAPHLRITRIENRYAVHAHSEAAAD